MPPRQATQKKGWIFVLNNPTPTEERRIQAVLKENCTWALYQHETGKNGTPHLQGSCSFTTKLRFTAIKRLVAIDRVHWEAMLGAPWQSVAYCSKDDTRTGGNWKHGTLPSKPSSGPKRRDMVQIEYTPQELGLIEPGHLWHWQQRVLTMCQETPDQRTIHWIWEAEGHTGKTAFCKYLVYYEKACLVGGKMADAATALDGFAGVHGYHPKIIIVDIPRCTMNFVSYQTIEKAKDALLFVSKYESKQLLFPTPHVVCFANEPPAYEKLSADRWHVIEIKKDSLDCMPCRAPSPQPQPQPGPAPAAGMAWAPTGIEDLFEEVPASPVIDFESFFPSDDEATNAYPPLN